MKTLNSQSNAVAHDLAALAERHPSIAPTVKKLLAGQPLNASIAFDPTWGEEILSELARLIYALIGIDAIRRSDLHLDPFNRPWYRYLPLTQEDALTALGDFSIPRVLADHSIQCLLDYGVLDQPQIFDQIALSWQANALTRLPKPFPIVTYILSQVRQVDHSDREDYRTLRRCAINLAIEHDWDDLLVDLTDKESELAIWQVARGLHLERHKKAPYYCLLTIIRHGYLYQDMPVERVTSTPTLCQALAYWAPRRQEWDLCRVLETKDSLTRCYLLING
ncbi:MAG: hypothetical protein D8B54_03585 [Catonella sp.]|nr:MAG: hypothetical protein D8B54_03585 [Catonella sp.]